MHEDEKPVTGPPIEPVQPDALAIEQQQQDEMGDFIARHVLEKDAVFFEG